MAVTSPATLYRRELKRDTQRYALPTVPRCFINVKCRFRDYGEDVLVRCCCFSAVTSFASDAIFRHNDEYHKASYFYELPR